MIRALRRLIGGLRALVARRRTDRDLDDELRAYLEADINARMASGMTRAEATRAARAAVGSAAAVRDYVRDARWESWLGGAWRDVRYAWRRLRAEPAFTVGVILTLALGIGVNTAIFSVADAAIFKAIPYKNPEQLVDFAYVFRRGSAEETRQLGITYRQLSGWRTQAGIFAGIETFRGPQAAAVNGAEVSEGTQVARISPGLVPLLGLAPLVGRGFGPHDARPDPDVALVGETYWRRELGADPAILGRSLVVDGRSVVIVGVMPAALSWKVNGRKVAVWLPLDEVSDRDTASSSFIATIGRLRDHLSLDQAQQAVRKVAAAIPGNEGEFSDVELMGLGDQTMFGGDERKALKIVLAAAGLVLLIACANVANLLLARGLARRREMALRRALGATRSQLIRQFAAEGVTLAVMGGGLAWLLARWSIATIAALVPEQLGLFEANPLVLDGRSLAFCGFAVFLTGFFCSSAAAAKTSRDDEPVQTNGTQRIIGTSLDGRRLTQVLQAVQVAFTVVLLIGMSLLTSSFAHMLRNEVGYDAPHLATANVFLRDAADLDPSSAENQFAALLSQVRQLPHLTAAYGASPVDGFYGQFMTDDREDIKASSTPILNTFWIGDNYLSVAGIPLMRGRPLGDTDRAGSPDVGLIDEKAAKRFWPGQNPIGRRFRVSPYLPWVTVVGVVGHVKTLMFTWPTGTIQAYLPVAQAPANQHAYRKLLLRSAGDPSMAISALRTVARHWNRQFRIDEMRAVDDLYGPTFVTPRFSLALMSLFAVLALLTAALGLYSLLTRAIVQRTNEIGIRLALGASTADVARQVIRETIVPVGVGLAAGVLVSLWLSKSLAALLFEVQPHDPIAFVISVAIVILASAIATLPPLRRATHVNPVVALRAE